MVDTGVLIAISAAVAVIFGLSIWAVSVSWKWVVFGVKLWYYDWRNKGKTGFLWRVDNSSNLGFPEFINLGNYSKEIGDDTFQYVRRQLQGLRF